MMAEKRIRPLSLAISAARRLCTSPSSASSTESVTAASNEHRSLYRRLSALRGDPAGSVEKTMEWWLSKRRSLSVSDLMKMVKDLRKYKSYDHALELLNWMAERGMQMTSSIHAVRIGLISKIEGIEMAERYFNCLPKSAKKKNQLLTHGALLHCYCQEKLGDKAIALYEKMKRHNLPSSILVQNNLMILYMKLGQPEKVHAQFQEMNAANITPQSITYNLLLSSYASLNDIESVERVLEEMKESGQVDLDWNTYCNLASYYISAGLSEKAESALKEAEKVMSLRDLEAYHFLISLYAATGNLSDIYRVWALMKATFNRILNRSYYIMFHALKRLDDLDGLKQCFEEWESSSIRYDVKLPNVVVDVYLRKGMVKEAEAVWAKRSEKGSGPNIMALDMSIDIYLKRHEMNLALKCLEIATYWVKQVEWKPDKDKMSTFMAYFEEVKDVDGAEEFCRILKKLNCLDAEAYDSLLRTYLAAERKEPSLRQRLDEYGIEIGSESEKLLEKVCATV